MAYPVVKYNSSTGSDTAPSDSVNNSTSSSVTASGTAGGTTITFSSAVDLTTNGGVADDDSDYIWCDTTTGGIHLFRITGFTTATDLTAVTAVTVEAAITADFSGQAWHINGTRQSLIAEESALQSTDAAAWGRGWTVELDGTFSGGNFGMFIANNESTAGAQGDPHFVMRASSSATTKPTISVTTSYTRIIRIQDWVSIHIEGIRLEAAITNANGAVDIGVGAVTMTDCEIVHTGTGIGVTRGFLYVTNGVLRLFDCYVQPKECAEVIRTANTQMIICDNCHFDCEGVGGASMVIEGNVENCVVTSTLITEAAGDGITIDVGTFFAMTAYWFIKNNTIADCGGAGVHIVGTNTSTSTQPKFGYYIANNLLVGNGTYGLDLDNSTTVFTANDVDYNAFYNNTSGEINGHPAGANDITLTADPFTDTGNGDYSLNNTAGGGALVRDGARYVIPGT